MNYPKQILPNLKSGDIALLLTALFFERAAYYGIRSILVLYLISEEIGLSSVEAITLYGTFTGGVYLCKLMAGVAGDLLKINRILLICGAALQIIAAVSFCIPTAITINGAFILLAIGAGLFQPNFNGIYARHLLAKRKSIDGGMSGLYLIINIGASLGMIAITFLGDVEFYHGFLMAALLAVLSLVCILFSKENTLPIPPKKLNGFSYYQYQWLIVIIILLNTGFWAIFEIYSGHFHELAGYDEFNFLFTQVNYSYFSIWSNSFLIFTIIGTGLIFLRNKGVNSMLLIAIGAGILLFVGTFTFLPSITITNNINLLLVLNGVLTIAEIFMATGTLGLMVKVANPRFLALFFGISSFATMIGMKSMTFVMTRFQFLIDDNEYIILIIALVFASILTALAIALIKITGIGLKRTDAAVTATNAPLNTDDII